MLYILICFVCLTIWIIHNLIFFGDLHSPSNCFYWLGGLTNFSYSFRTKFRVKRRKAVLPCKKEGTSECEVSQCRSEPSSEHVNKWSGFVGWKWTSHTVNERNKSLNKEICKTHKKNKVWVSYFLQSEPPWVRKVCCLVLHPRHTACHLALL